MEIFTKEDKDLVVQTLADIEILWKEIARAKRAGIDTTEMEATLRKAEADLRKIHAVYIAPGS